MNPIRLGSPRAPCRGLCSSLLAAPLFCLLSACSDSKSGGGTDCTPDDEDGVLGDRMAVLLSISDTAFSVGGVDSGSDQRNITLQNSTKLTLTVTNTGTKPHSMVVQCIPSGLPEGCPQKSCFPDAANLGPLDPGMSKTVTYTLPLVEGTYPFKSDVSGDDDLTGQFVLI